MQFTFETDYNRKTLAVLSKCLRKTEGKAKNRRYHLVGGIVLAAALLPPFNGLRWLAAPFILLVLLFEDQMNAFFAQRQMLKGTERATAVFDTDNAEFLVETAVGKAAFPYDAILCVAETEGYFVFALSKTHGQIYDKSRLTGGTADDFRAFIGERTGKAVVPVR